MPGKTGKMANFMSHSDSGDLKTSDSAARNGDEERPCEPAGSAPIGKADDGYEALSVLQGAHVKGAGNTSTPNEAAQDAFALAYQALDLVSQLEAENARLKQDCQQKDAAIAELKERSESQADREGASEADRKHLEEVRTSLEQANARLVAENNELKVRCASLEEKLGIEGTSSQPRETHYVAPQTSAPEEFREAIEDSDFFEWGDKAEKPEFHMPGRFFSFGKGHAQKSDRES